MTSPLRSLAGEPADSLATAPGPGELDLEDRAALRRVAGMSTELQDISEVEYRELRLERVVLIGVWTEGTLASAENSLRELSRLAETAGSLVLDGLIQRRGKPDPATYVGAGKASVFFRPSRNQTTVPARSSSNTVLAVRNLTAKITASSAACIASQTSAIGAMVDFNSAFNSASP